MQYFRFQEAWIVIRSHRYVTICLLRRARPRAGFVTRSSPVHQPQSIHWLPGNSLPRWRWQANVSVSPKLALLSVPKLARHISLLATALSNWWSFNHISVHHLMAGNCKSYGRFDTGVAFHFRAQEGRGNILCLLWFLRLLICSAPTDFIALDSSWKPISSQALHLHFFGKDKYVCLIYPYLCGPLELSDPDSSPEYNN